MKNRMRVLAGMLIVVLSMTFVSGCSSKTTSEETIKVTPMEKEVVHKESYDIIGGDDVMPIGGFYGLSLTWYTADGNVFEDYVTDEYMEKIVDAGINVLNYNSYDYATNPEIVIKSLELAEKYGVGYYVYDSYIVNMYKDEEIDLEKVGSRVAEYSDYPAFAGLHIVDEPNSPNYMPELGEKYISQYVKLCDALRTLNINYHNGILPCYQYDKLGEPEKFEAYIVEYLEGFKPSILGYDHYPFDPLASKEPLKLYEYFWNMDLFREYSMKYNIPFEVTIQAGGQWNDGHKHFDSVDYFPNEGQFYWNINTCLAFGAKSLTMFPVIQPANFAYAESTEWDFERNGLIGAIGNKNQWYFYLQNITKHIRAIDEVLMNCVSKGVVVSGEEATKDMECTKYTLIESGKFQELHAVDGDAMIGCFNYHGKTALYVVNYDMEYAQKVTLQLNESHNMTKIQDAKTSYVKGQNITLDMAAGEGVLLVIE